MTNNPIISIIMPNLNGQKYLVKSIESFISQDYVNKELIIVDGKSTDSSHQIIEKYSKTYKEIIWIKEKDKGISDAINIGIDFSSGDIIGFLGSDDILYKGVFDEIAYNNSWCSFDAIYFNSYTHDIKKNKCLLRKCPNMEFTKANILSYGTIVGLQNIFFKRHVYDVYKYDTNNKYSMDYEFYLRISKENYCYLYCDKVATINIFDGNISSDITGGQFDESCEVTKKYSNGYWGHLHFSKYNNIIHKGRKLLRRLFIN
jgi:glycosyltransferase involved in cell wall biosynthesis